jgi:lipid A 3-O-deacylase
MSTHFRSWSRPRRNARAKTCLLRSYLRQAATLAALCLTFNVSSVSATDNALLHEVRVGALLHDVDNLWAHSRKERGTDFNLEAVFAAPLMQLGPGTLRPNLGASINSSGDTSKIYAGVVWQVEHQSGLFLELGLGGAIHNGETDARKRDAKRLGSRVLFRMPLEIGYTPDGHHRFSIMFEHISNGYLASPQRRTRYPRCALRLSLPRAVFVPNGQGFKLFASHQAIT